MYHDHTIQDTILFQGFFHTPSGAVRTARELSGSRHELEEWQDGAGQVLAVQIQAGGLGVDLTRAAYCIYYSLGFSLSEYEQSLARVHRPGQTRPVAYYHLIAEHTVDRREMNQRADDRGLETLVMPPVQRLVGEGAPSEFVR